MWIWSSSRRPGAIHHSIAGPNVSTDNYNRSILARKRFSIADHASASIAVTADSAYRLFVNGVRVTDGPARGWPEHYQFDDIDITGLLKIGENEVSIVARYFGIGTFHQVPQQPGLLASIELHTSEGTKTIVTDASWEIADYLPLVKNTPKICIQMEAFETIDSRLAEGMVFENAIELCGAEAGPWQDLTARTTRLLSDTERYAENLSVATVLKSGPSFSVPAARMLYPDKIECNFALFVGHAIATIIDCDRPAEQTIRMEGYRCFLNGSAINEAGVAVLNRGENLLVAFATKVFGHQKDFDLRFVTPLGPGVELINPRRGDSLSPFEFLWFPDYKYAKDDLTAFWFPREEQRRIAADYDSAVDRIAPALTDSAALNRIDESAGTTVLVDAFSGQNEPSTDVHGMFIDRIPTHGAEIEGELLENPDALLADTPERTVVRSSKDGDTEIMLDFGEQICGYIEIDLDADEGTILDFFLVEYIREDGAIQHTLENRNGCRYICSSGTNKFLSLKRRAGRYLFLTIRNTSDPVSIRLVKIRESTYPRRLIGSFSSSDAMLDRIWRISERTLQLCSEDTFTDCPLYEQTLWVGDARNESLFALPVYGAEDLVRRCIVVAGESLERYPIVGCQLPSSWDILMPVWSALWGISIWDFYFYSGDIDFLRSTWPLVLRNLEGAMGLRDKRGLLSAPYWNMFDWSGTDDEHRTVLHNSMFFVGAIDAAAKSAVVLGDVDAGRKLAKYRDELVLSIEATWDEASGSYPDAILETGASSPSVSRHTAFLDVLYNISAGERRDASIRSMVDPLDGTVGVGSPFAMLYLYEAFDSVGLQEKIVESIYESYAPMVESGATTVWEVFPESDDRPEGFPTRSHTHGWSSAPLAMLPLVILGIRQIEVGGAAYEISPHLSGLERATGRVATARGPLRVRWSIENRELLIDAIGTRGTRGTRFEYRYNKSHSGLNVRFNGQTIGGVN